MYRSYDLHTIEDLISRCADNDYKIVQVEEGTLGLGHLLLVAPAPGFWSFEIYEEARNQWSSWHKLRRFTRISKRVQALADAVD